MVGWPCWVWSMEGELGVILWQVIVGGALLFGIGLFPGLVILRVLDPGADRFRRLLLVPALSLMVSYGISGWMVILTGKFDLAVLLLLLIAANGLSIAGLWQRDVVRVRRLSPWERLQEKVEVNDDDEEDGGEDAGSTKVSARIEGEEETVRIEEDVEEAEEKRKDLLRRRASWFPIALAASALLALLPLFLFTYPNGVDWIGFSTLSHRLATTGDLTLPAASVGSWTYPPAFPAMCALLESVLRLSPASAVHLVGQLSLLALLWGLAGAADKWGAGAPTLLCMGLAPALFAKAHDSGYPTVASQIGIVLGLLVLLRPVGERSRSHDLLFAVCVIAVGAIHPTGSLYLGTLLLANLLLTRYEAQNNAEVGRLALTSVILLVLASAIVLLGYAPRLLAEPVFSEYGWQGGLRLLIYNSPILIALALVSFWRGKRSTEVLVLSAWLGLQWLLTLVHLLSGVIFFPIFTLLSYVLYSMALHAFHIPLAVLAGILLAEGAKLTPRLKRISIDEHGEAVVAELLEASRRLGAEAVVESAPSGVDDAEVEKGLWIPMELPGPTSTALSFGVLALVLLQVFGANVVLFELSEHPELRPQTDGDRALMSSLDLPPGSLIFTEDAHWGDIYDLPADVAVTSFPSLGLVEVQSSIQGKTKQAILSDDHERIQSLGITHALTSPLGTFGAVLAASDHWTIERDVEGSRLWTFEQMPTTRSALRSSFTYPVEEACVGNCDWRPDPWWMVDMDQFVNRPDHQPVLTEGELSLAAPLARDARDRAVMLHLMVDAPAGLSVEIHVVDSGEHESLSYTTAGGWEQLSLALHTSTDNRIEVTVKVSGGGETWINPTGASGRGDRIFDESGVRLHWVELRPMVR